MSFLGRCPSSFKAILVHTKSSDFRAATHIVEEQMPSSLAPLDVLIKNEYVGINASDVNFTKGIYKRNATCPFHCGFEALGTIVGKGEAVKALRLGDSVCVQSYSAFGEYQKVSLRAGFNRIHQVPSLDPRYLALEISGVTAYLALQIYGNPKPGETAFVTAGAGGAGHFAVQLLRKFYDCNVVASCSSNAKKELLLGLGCHRVINYKEESMDAVLRREFPGGINLFFESVGGTVFETCIQHLALKGRMVIIGSVSGYKDSSSFGLTNMRVVPIGTFLLQRSATISGFFLPFFPHHQADAYDEMHRLMRQGVVTPVIDQKKFEGMESVADAIEHLLSRENIGKVIVKVQKE